MYEFHGWFGISESPEEADIGGLSEGIAELRALIAGIDWATGEVSLTLHNGQYFVLANGLMNRRRDEARELDQLLLYIAGRFRGAWGILYERSDDMDRPPGSGAFRVRVMAKGEVKVRMDPFLSPCYPVIED
ncbi:Imm7 family immunity protein [Streptomyces sp. NRRL F-5135]|uniref:Imm7 family immunity protein n=1 Tax=Streptomyces sp. NRRL F-5135 TaxID=1463858 RepID=UPI0004C829DB|nr:Imm7 family immunity protein [Streptomyces sp. NRRL F-5135]